MEMDVNLATAYAANGAAKKAASAKPLCAIELMTISANAYSSNNNGAAARPHVGHTPNAIAAAASASAGSRRSGGCCGILSRLLCGSAGKTASSSGDYNNFSGLGVMAPLHPPSTICGGGNISIGGGGVSQCQRKTHHRRTPQEVYFESRGKSCKKLLKFNGSSNKILLYPEEGWARTASSSYWTITPCWWQPNRCRIEEFAGTQRQATKAKMVALEQKGSLLIAGHFRSKKSPSSSSCGNTGWASAAIKDKDADEFKLYLSSNISMEDYNMGYCLTGFVERRCQQTNTFQMTHFAVIKRQWPSISSGNGSGSSAGGGGGGGGGGSGDAATKST